MQQGALEGSSQAQSCQVYARGHAATRFAQRLHPRAPQLRSPGVSDPGENSWETGLLNCPMSPVALLSLEAPTVLRVQDQLAGESPDIAAVADQALPVDVALFESVTQAGE